MTQVSLSDIVDLINSGAQRGDDLADAMYKKVNEILDRSVASRKTSFAEEGTSDNDALKFCIAAQFTHQTLDPGLVSALLTAAIWRLARQP